MDFDGSELERQVTNTGTNDAIVQEFMTKCRRDATGTLPAKTIIFAMSHRHAVEIYKSFNRLYPDQQRRGLAEIIDSHMERAEKQYHPVRRWPYGTDANAVGHLLKLPQVFVFVAGVRLIAGSCDRLLESRARGPTLFGRHSDAHHCDLYLTHSFAQANIVSGGPMNETLSNTYRSQR